MNFQPQLEPGNPSHTPPPRTLTGEGVPGWGHRLTAPCPSCGLATHRHRTLDFDGVTTYRSNAGPDPTRLDGTSGGEPEGKKLWIALVPGDYPVRYFADDEIYHLAGGIAWPGQHHRDYGTAKIAHNACCPGRHENQPASSRGAAELWQAMRVRRARPPRIP
ncbi:DUF6083 domain-containing protein (plasmid) [Streptomyces scopuliridis]|uniref:DUF6083 domain-containing protein n=1 Tax=Streptomyces scopuliridis TaxID=452529 RepID=UPI002DDB8EC7|nr:DUF6083 domain-containing protein [Streptomyces scopuliridis]WSB39142.1 DUF6083 domain-containing protein [Streptomyces scopuliridis]